MADLASILAFRSLVTGLMANDEARSAEARALVRAPLFSTFDSIGYLELVRTNALDSLVRWRFGDDVFRARASCARGVVKLTNSGAALHQIAPGAITITHATTGKVYRNLSIAAVGPKGSAGLGVEAELPGDASTAAPGTLTSLSPPLAGVTSTNERALVGADAETDLELRARARGPRSFPIDLVRNVRRANASRVGCLRFAGSTTSSVASVAMLTGAISAPDLEVVRGFVPPHLRAGLIAATPLPVPLTYTLTVLDDPAVPASPALAAAIAARVAEHLSTVPVGPSTLWRDALDTVIRNALGMAERSYVAPGSSSPVDALMIDATTSGLVSLSIASPAADVVLDAHEFPILGTVTPTIVRV
jgi:hypothetical protein